MKLYLSSYEYDDFAATREVLKYHKTIIDNRNVLIVEVDEPLIGQKFGFGGQDINKFYLVNRVAENSFERHNQFPIDVHVLIPINKKITNPSSLTELQNIAWACLYNNEKDAHNHKII